MFTFRFATNFSIGYLRKALTPALTPVLTKVSIALCMLIMLSACKVTPLDTVGSVELTDAQLLNDNIFPEHSSYAIESQTDIFHLGNNARDFVDTSIRGQREEHRKIKTLVEAIFERSDLDLIYEEDANTVANATFENGVANCLSLSIMTYAMADYAGFTSNFQEVSIPEYWTRRSGLSLLNGHINLSIQPRMQSGVTRFLNASTIVDFDLEISSKRFPAKIIDKQLVIAMFYNNRGTDALIENKFNKAYAYLKAAIEADSGFTGAWVNLGYLYRLIGEVKLAEQSYLKAISLDDEHYTAWENLAILYRNTGNVESAETITSYIESQRRANPYYHFMLGQVALDRSNIQQSILHFQEAIRLDDSQHQFFFNLASAYYQKGDLSNAQRYMTAARKKAGTTDAASAYANKVSALNALQDRSPR